MPSRSPAMQVSGWWTMGLRQVCRVLVVSWIIVCGLAAAQIPALNYTIGSDAVMVQGFTSLPAPDHAAHLGEILAIAPGRSFSGYSLAADAGAAAPDIAILALPEPTVSASIGPSDSIQAAVFAASDGDTIWLDPGIYREHDIVIDRNITIRAKTSAGGNRGNTIIDAEHAGRIFNVTGPFTFAIDNLALINGEVSSADPDVPAEGGAILAMDPGSTLIVASSGFSDCQVTTLAGLVEGDGGAIAAYGPLSIIGSSFANCSVSGAGEKHAGGAIYSGDISSAMTSSAFTNCSVSGSSGAGGAVIGVYSITSSTFEDCSVTGTDALGGAVAFAMNVTGCTFINCSVTGSGIGGIAYGGAVFGFTSISSSSFTHCSVTGTDEAAGGAVCYGDTITDSSFTDCSASGPTIAAGGAACDFVNITGSSFTRCSATSSNQAEGGAVYNGYSVSRSTFTGCSASGGDFGSGGAVGFLHDVVSDSVFTDCSVSGSRFAAGGATVITRNITGSSFTRCSATGSEQAEGGAIYRSENIIRSTFNSCSVSGGTGALGGAIIYGQNVSGSAFTGCNAYDGGAIYFPVYMGATACTIASSTFSGCSARDTGGSIYTDGVDLTIGNSTTFSGSSAENYGGTLYIKDGNVVLDRVSMTNSRAISGGGGAIAFGHSGSLTITSSNFERCSAPDGGAILSGNPPAIHFCRFWQNTATGTGPAIRTMGGTVHAENNWWGTNSDPAPQVYGDVITAPWLILRITSNPASFTSYETARITADLNHDSDDADTSSLGHVPDAIPCTFRVPDGRGSVTPDSVGTVSGAAVSTFTPERPGSCTVTATIDGQTVYLPLWINSPVVTTPDTSQNDGGSPSPAVQPTIQAATLPLMTVTVNIGGDSKAWQAIVTGTNLADLVVTGTVQPGPGSNLSAPPGVVYQYLTLVPARYDTITRATINFTVPQSWLDGNHIAPGSIVLFHRTANGWEALPTTVLSTKDGTGYFSAESTGFSLFAIAGAPAALTPPVVPATQETRDSPVTEQTPAPAAAAKVPVTTHTTAPAPAPDAPAGSSAFPVLPALAGVGCVGLVGGGWYVRRWWIRRQNPALFEDS
jgi:uncharacterized protein YjbI with pentapeptide repeats